MYLQGAQPDLFGATRLRRLAAAATANDAMDLLLQEAGDAGSLGSQPGFTEVNHLLAQAGPTWCCVHQAVCAGWFTGTLLRDRKSAGAW